VEGRAAIIRATIVRLSLNDANKFDYSCFEILLLLRKCRHHRRHHRRRCPSARRVETRGPGDHSRRFEPTRAPSRPARIYFTAKQKISERLGLRRLALLTPRLVALAPRQMKKRAYIYVHASARARVCVCAERVGLLLRASLAMHQAYVKYARQRTFHPIAAFVGTLSRIISERA